VDDDGHRDCHGAEDGADDGAGQRFGVAIEGGLIGCSSTGAATRARRRWS